MNALDKENDDPLYVSKNNRMPLIKILKMQRIREWCLSIYRI